MPAEDNSYKIPGAVVVTVIGILLSGAISANVWAVTGIYDRPTEDRVRELIEDKSPFSKDRSMILQALTDLKETNTELRKALENNTQQVIELKAIVGSR